MSFGDETLEPLTPEELDRLYLIRVIHAVLPVIRCATDVLRSVHCGGTAGELEHVGDELAEALKVVMR